MLAAILIVLLAMFRLAERGRGLLAEEELA
jgi:hypothetical protein